MDVDENWNSPHNALLGVKKIDVTLLNDVDLKRTLHMLKENKSIQEANLAFSTNINAEKSRQLALSIQQSQIPQLSLDRKAFCALSDFLRGLQYARALKTLKISFKPNAEECSALAEVIEKSDLECFQVLGLPFTFGSRQHDQTMTDAMKQLALAITRCASMRIVHLREVPPESVNLLLGPLAHNQIKLEELAFTCTAMTDDNMRALSTAMKTNTTLTSLHFTRCELDDTQMTLLSEGLKHNSKLTTLILHYNPSTIGSLCEALKANNSLTTLDLTDSNINDDACTHIAAMLEHNQALRSLVLTSNRFETEGIRAICHTMANNTTITELKINGNKCTSEAMTGVKHMLTHNSSLRSLDISHKSSDGLSLLCEGLRANTGLTKLAVHLALDMLEATQTSLVQVLEHNLALDTVAIKVLFGNYSDFPPSQLQRNRQLKSDARFKVAVLSHNISRSQEALAILPRETWKLILSSITQPGMDSFKPLVDRIFSSYLLEQK